MTEALDLSLPPEEPIGRWDTKVLATALRARFCAPEWAFFREVRNATGYQRVTRSADGIAMGLWPSRGMELHGFEIKASRSDWLRELKAPAKAEEIARYCDRWWIVAAPKVVLAGELPPTWGLMEPRGKALAAKVEAPKLPAQPLDRAFVAALLRVASESSAAKAEIDAAVKAETERMGAIQEKAIESDRRSRDGSYTALRKIIDAFEAASGVKIDRYSEGEIGEAVAFVRRHNLAGWGGLAKRLEKMRDEAASMVADIDRALKEGEDQ